MKFPLTDADRKRFREDGVVCLRGVLSKSEIEGLRDAVDEQMQQRDVSPTAYDFEEIGADIWREEEELQTHGATRINLDAMKHNISKDTAARPLRDTSEHSGGDRSGMFFYDVAGWRRLAAIREAAFDSALPEIAFHIMDSGYVNFWEDTTFVKMPGTQQRTAFHQDLTYSQSTGRKCMIAWIPLDPSGVDNGVLQYVKGSHLWDKEFAPNVFVAQTPTTGSTGPKVPDIEANPENYEIIHFDVQPGDVLIHDVRTLHGSSGNLSNRPRRAISFRYCGDDMRYLDRPGAVPQVSQNHDLKDGDRLFADDYPIVYPKPWPSMKLSKLYN